MPKALTDVERGASRRPAARAGVRGEIFSSLIADV